MPTYEYACGSCGHHLEVSQSFSEDPLTTCPNCGGPLRKVFGSIGIVLKGSGFYRTDSRAAANGAGAKKKEKDSASATSSDASSPGSTSSGDSSSSSSDSGGSGSSTGPGSSSGSSSGDSTTKAAASA
jgi:putative FmdB family regulatory protein